MDNSNSDEVLERLNQLEDKLEVIEHFLSTYSIQNAVQVTGALNVSKLVKVNLSEFELVELYNNTPHFFSNLVIKVSLTGESYRQQNQGQIFLQKDNNGNYWIIPTENNIYWLLPKVNIKINRPIMRTLESLFQCQEYQRAKNAEFNIIKPARVSLSINGVQWKLEEKGEIHFSNSYYSSQLPSKLQQIEEEYQQIRLEIKKLTQEFWRLRDILKKQNIIDDNAPKNNTSILTQKTKKEPIQRTSQPTSDNWKNAQLLFTLTGHTHLVRSLSISLDNQILASGSFDNTIKIWNLNTGELIDTYHDKSRVQVVSLAPSRQILFSGHDDKTIKIWNLSLGVVENTLIGHSDWIRCLAISLDGKIIASGSRDKTIKIWNLETCETLYTLTGHRGTVLAIAISPDGKTLASGSADNSIKLWNIQTGKLIHNFDKHSGLVCSVAITADGKNLVSGSCDNTINRWNLKTKKLQNTLTGHLNGVWSIAISPNGQILASSGGDNKIKLWNLQTGEQLCNLTGYNNGVYSVSFSPDGQTLVSGDRDKTIKVWKSSTFGDLEMSINKEET